MKYSSQYTSVALIKQAHQVADVYDTVIDLFNFEYLLLIIDIPIISVLLHKTRFAESTLSTFRKRSAYLVLIATLLLIPPIAVFANPFSSPTLAGLKSTEFFSYHINDIYLHAFKSDAEEIRLSDYNIAELEMPASTKGEMFGIAKGRNLIVIQVESLQGFVVNRFYNGQEITPELNKLIKDQGTIYFDNYYQQIGRGNTSDAEFATQNSLYPTIHGQAYTEYERNYFYGLPWILKDKGYSTSAFHGYKKDFWNRNNAYVNQGFDTFIGGDDFKLNEKIGLGISDIDFFRQSTIFMKAQSQPFYSFLITLSSHNPYEVPPEYQEIKISEEHKNTTFGRYLNAIHYADKALGEFILNLKENGLYDNSIITIYGDHFGILKSDTDSSRAVSDILGYEYDYDEVMKVPLIIHIPGKSVNKTVSVLGSQLDFAPTILNLIGIERNNLVLLGQDLLNAEHGFVATQTQMLKGSFIQDDIVFEFSRDGIFENSRAWNKSTREPVDIALCREGYERAIKEIDISNYILENNLIEQLMNRKSNLGTISKPKDILKAEPLVARNNTKLKTLQFLDESYKKGFKFIELRFHWSSDDIPTLKDMSLKELSEWLNKHPDVYIITAESQKNEQLLRFILDNYKPIQNKIIPQIYHMGEHIKVEYLGYKNIIFVPSKNDAVKDIIDFAQRSKLLAVKLDDTTMQDELIRSLEDINVFTYLDTTNPKINKNDLKALGIDGFYE